jgi:hypothetical protein
MTDERDPNRELAPLVEGFVMGAVDWRKLAGLPEAIGWRAEFVDLDRHALVFTSPSGLRWRIVAELVEDPPDDYD